MNPLKPIDQQNQNAIQQISEEQIRRNKEAATVILLRMCESLKIETASHVDKTTIVTRTEQL